MNLQSLFENFQTSAFRLEGLPRYSTPKEQEAFRYFQAVQQLPASFNDKWVQFVKDETSKGKVIQRLRLVSNELTDYEKFEMTAYRQDESREDIRFIDRVGQPYKYDFWLFDNRWLVKMNYDDNGSYIDSQTLDASERHEEITYWTTIYESARTQQH